MPPRSACCSWPPPSPSCLARSPPKPTARRETPEGFTALFNGKDLTGWHGMPHFDPRALAAMPERRGAGQEDRRVDRGRQEALDVENGDLVNDGNGAYLTTDKEYGDIELLIDYKTVAKADSGIYLRGTPQVQIWDSTEAGGKWNLGADKGSGGLWNNSPGAPGKDPLVLADKPFGEWNQLRIIQVGARTTVYLNDKLVVDHAIMENFWDRSLAPLRPRRRSSSRPTAARSAGGTSSSAKSPPTRPTRSSPSTGAEASIPIFDGKTLDGWAGAVDNYEVVDGAIRCKPEKGGVALLQEGAIRDFVARVEFKLPPGGNNGLAIRYPGKGDTAYGGMCELQVLDDTDARSTPRSTPARPTARPTAWSPPSAVPPAGRRVELRGSHRQGLDDQGRTERHRHPRHRPEQGHRVHGQLAPPRQGPDLGLLRLRRPRRPRRVPGRRRQAVEIKPVKPANLGVLASQGGTDRRLVFRNSPTEFERLQRVPRDAGLSDGPGRRPPGAGLAMVRHPYEGSRTCSASSRDGRPGTRSRGRGPAAPKSITWRGGTCCRP